VIDVLVEGRTESENDKLYSPWLGSKLFSGGIVSLTTDETSFLENFVQMEVDTSDLFLTTCSQPSFCIHSLSIPVSPPMALWYWIYRTTRNRTHLPLIARDSVFRVERAAIAAMIHHLGVTKLVVRLAQRLAALDVCENSSCEFVNSKREQSHDENFFRHTLHILKELCTKARSAANYVQSRGNLEKKWALWLSNLNDFEWEQPPSDLFRLCEMKGVLVDRSDQNGAVRRLYERLQQESDEILKKGKQEQKQNCWEIAAFPVTERALLLLKLKVETHLLDYPSVDISNPFAIHRTYQGIIQPVSNPPSDSFDALNLHAKRISNRLSPQLQGITARIQRSFTDFPETEHAKRAHSRKIRSQHQDNALERRAGELRTWLRAYSHWKQWQEESISGTPGNDSESPEAIISSIQSFLQNYQLDCTTVFAKIRDQARLYHTRQEGLRCYCQLLHAVSTSNLQLQLTERIHTFHCGHYFDGIETTGNALRIEISNIFGDYFSNVMNIFRDIRTPIGVRIQCLSIFQIEFRIHDAPLLRKESVFSLLRDAFMAPRPQREKKEKKEKKEEKERKEEKEKKEKEDVDMRKNNEDNINEEQSDPIKETPSDTNDETKVSKPLEKVEIKVDSLEHKDSHEDITRRTSEKLCLSHENPTETDQQWATLRATSWIAFRFLAIILMGWNAADDNQVNEEVKLLRENMFFVVCSEVKRVVESDGKVGVEGDDATSPELLFEMLSLLYALSSSQRSREALSKHNNIEMVLSILRCTNDHLVTPRTRLVALRLCKRLLPSYEKPKSSWVLLFLKEIGRWSLFGLQNEQTKVLSKHLKRPLNELSLPNAKKTKKNVPRVTAVEERRSVHDIPFDFSPNFLVSEMSEEEVDEDEEEVVDSEDGSADPSSDEDGPMFDVGTEGEDDGDDLEENGDGMGIYLHSWSGKADALLSVLRGNRGQSNPSFSTKRKKLCRIDYLRTVLQTMSSRGEALLDKGSEDYCYEIGRLIASEGGVASVFDMKCHSSTEEGRKLNLKSAERQPVSWICGQMAACFASEFVALLRLLSESSCGAWGTVVRRQIERGIQYLFEVLKEPSQTNNDLTEKEKIELEESLGNIPKEKMETYGGLFDSQHFSKLCYAIGAISVAGGFTENIRIGSKVLVDSLRDKNIVTKGTIISSEGWVEEKCASNDINPFYQLASHHFSTPPSYVVSLENSPEAFTVFPGSDITAIPEKEFNPNSLLLSSSSLKTLVECLSLSFAPPISSDLPSPDWKLCSMGIPYWVRSEIHCRLLKSFLSLLQSEPVLGMLKHHFNDEVVKMVLNLCKIGEETGVVTIDIEGIAARRNILSQQFLNSYRLSDFDVGIESSSVLLLPESLASYHPPSLDRILPHFPYSGLCSSLPTAFELPQSSILTSCMFLERNVVEICGPNDSNSGSGNRRGTAIPIGGGRYRRSSSYGSSPSGVPIVIVNQPYPVDVAEVYFEVLIEFLGSPRDPSVAIGLLPECGALTKPHRTWGCGSYRYTSTGKKVFSDSRNEKQEDYSEGWEGDEVVVGVYYNRTAKIICFSCDQRMPGVAFRYILFILFFTFLLKII
jgi:hypothetical protein